MGVEQNQSVRINVANWTVERTMRVTLLALPLALMLGAASDGVPHLNVTPSCKGAAEAGYIARTEDRLKSCLDSEQRTRDDLVKNWSTFPAADRAYCISSIRGFEPTYTELVTCLEMKRDVRNTATKPKAAAPLTTDGTATIDPAAKMR
jgi:hypothetical protein